MGRLGVGVGEGDADDVADSDGFALVGEAEGTATAGGTMVTAGVLAVGDRLEDAEPDDTELDVTETTAESLESSQTGQQRPPRMYETPSASTETIPSKRQRSGCQTAAATPDKRATAAWET